MRISEETKALIRKERESGKTLYELVSQFGHSKSSVYNIIKDCDDSLVKRAAPSRRVVTKATLENPRPNLSKTDLGEAARQMICARMMLNGVNVFRPMTEDTPIDLLVLTSNRILRCQCKCLYFDRRSGKHLMNLFSVRKNGPGSKARKHLYTADEVDFFLGYCFENDAVYVIPFKGAGGRQRLTFWIAREKMGSNGGDAFNPDDYVERYDLLTL